MLLVFKLRDMKLYYRIAHQDTQQGLWYDSEGNFTGLIHNEFNFCMNKDLLMPFDPELVGWLSATGSLEDLFNWFPEEDIERLENHGWFITVYEAEKVKQYRNHLVICQETSLVRERLPLSCVKMNNGEQKLVLSFKEDLMRQIRANRQLLSLAEHHNELKTATNLKHIVNELEELLANCI